MRRRSSPDTRRPRLAVHRRVSVGTTGQERADPTARSRAVQVPLSAGVYVKHLTTGEEAAVRADDAFSSASIIKLTIMVRAFQLVDQKMLNLDERVPIRRADLRDGSGVLQYHDLGQTPTIRDLITEMVITSDNVATDLMVTRVGGVDSLNAWLKRSGFSRLSMVARGHVYRRKILALVNPAFDTLTAEETTGLNTPSRAIRCSIFTRRSSRANARNGWHWCVIPPTKKFWRMADTACRCRIARTGWAT